MFDAATSTGEQPAARAFEADVHALEQSVAAVVGVINAANGQLVELVGDALAKDLWKQWGIHSPSHWLGWQAGMTPAHAEGIVRLAERRAEVPAAVQALATGALSLDAAVAIGKRAPAGFDDDITEFAKVATIGQLTHCLRKHRYDPETEKGRPKPREEQARGFSSGVDDEGWWCRARLTPDEGAVLDQAVQSARDDRFRLLDAERAEGEPAPQVSLADGFLAVGEAALAHGAAAHPGSDRYLVHLHLDASPAADDPTGVLSLHLGAPLPAALHGLLTCDAVLRPVFEVHGTAISLGRTTRVVNRRTRRVIEQRDHGCRVPGCGRRFGLDIHHIEHWEHGGATDTANLVCLCRRHHRLHHRGALGIAGDADLPADADGALTFTDPFGRPLDRAGRPSRLPPGATAAEAARAHGLDPAPDAYRHPLGERLQPGAVLFGPNRPSPPDEGDEPAPSPPPGPVAAPDGDPPDRPDGRPVSGAPPPEETVPTIGRWRSIGVVGAERPGSASGAWNGSSTT